MFKFFASIKDRLSALEQHVETIYAHLRGKSEVPNVSGVVDTVSAQPATSETVVTESTENGSAN